MDASRSTADGQSAEPISWDHPQLLLSIPPHHMNTSSPILSPVASSTHTPSPGSSPLRLFHSQLVAESPRRGNSPRTRRLKRMADDIIARTVLSFFDLSSPVRNEPGIALRVRRRVIYWPTLPVCGVRLHWACCGEERVEEGVQGSQQLRQGAPLHFFGGV